jgi:hypothetical protein
MPKITTGYIGKCVGEIMNFAEKYYRSAMAF